MANPNCKNFATCGNQTNQIPNTNPPRYFELCPACDRAKKSSTAGGTKAEKSSIAVSYSKPEIPSGSSSYKIQILIIAEKDGQPLANENVRILYASKIFDLSEVTDSSGMLEFEFDEIPVSEKGKQELRVKVGQYWSTINIDLPSEKAEAYEISIVLQDAKVVGDEIEVKFEIKSDKPEAPVLFLKGFENLEPARKTSKKNNRHLFTKCEPKSEAGKTVTYRFIVDVPNGDEKTATITLPEFPEAPKPKETCPHCGGSSKCESSKTGKITHSCKRCLSKADTRNQLSTVACSFCKQS